jgi:hypothetical protein
VDKIALMLANYFHDLAVALLASNVLVIHLVGRFLDGQEGREQIMGRLIGQLSKVTWWILTYVVVMGGVRAWFFMDFEWNPAVGKGQVVALIVKHILLVAVTVFGLVGQHRYKERFSGRN